MERTYEKSVTVTAPPTEVGSEYSLADYQGDIQKILATKARIAPAGAYRDGDTLRYGGAVVFNVLYADTEGKLTGVTNTVDYDISLPVEENAEARDFAVTVEGLSVRPTGPRKINMRATLVARAELVTKEPLPTVGQEGIECRTTAVYTVEKTYLSPTEREYGEETEPIRTLSLEVLFTDGKLALTDCKLREDGIEARGEITLTALVRTAEGIPLSVAQRIPFSELLPTDGKNKKAAFAAGNITSLTVTPKNGEDGTALAFSCLVELSGYTVEEREETALTDAYAQEYESDLSYGVFPSLRCLYGGTAKVQIRETVEKPTDCTAMRDILYQSAEAKTESAALTENALTVTGKIAFFYVGSREDENGTPVYCHEKTEVPFTAEIPVEVATPSDCRTDLNVCLSRVEVKIDAGTVLLSADLLLHVCIYSAREETVLTAVTPNENAPIPHEKNLIRVYYPAKGESLWDVAKAHHVPLSKLLADNRLTDVPASAVPLPKKLFIYD